MAKKIINAGYVSAYGIAVKNGFEGSEQQWLESLKDFTPNVLYFICTTDFDVIEPFVEEEHTIEYGDIDEGSDGASYNDVINAMRTTAEDLDRSKINIFRVLLNGENTEDFAELTFYQLDDNTYTTTPLYVFGPDGLEIHFYKLGMRNSGSRYTMFISRFVLLLPQ